MASSQSSCPSDSKLEVARGELRGEELGDSAYDTAVAFLSPWPPTEVRLIALTEVNDFRAPKMESSCDSRFGDGLVTMGMSFRRLGGGVVAKLSRSTLLSMAGRSYEARSFFLLQL